MCGSVVGCCTVQSEGLRPMMWSRTRAGFTLNIIDTPGLIEGGYINEQAVDIIKRYAHFSISAFQHIESYPYLPESEAICYRFYSM
jgi:hypothetical protein